MKNALLTALAALLIWSIGSTSAEACCAVTRDGSLVVNADQTVIMIWDQGTRTQHFIRQANFKTDATDVGFILYLSVDPDQSLLDTRSTISQPTHDVALLGFLVVFSACRLGRRSRRGEQTRMGEL